LPSWPHVAAGKELPAELAIGSEFTIYVDATNADSRRQLTPADAKAIVAKPRPLTELAGLVLASDARVYGNETWVSPHKRAKRKQYVGHAMTPEEREIAADDVHRLAFNVTLAVGDELKTRRRRAARATKKKSRGRPYRNRNATPSVWTEPSSKDREYIQCRPAASLSRAGAAPCPKTPDPARVLQNH
jgi:hypothetical protein